MSQFYYITDTTDEIKLETQPDDFEMDDEWRDDLRLALIEIGYVPALMRRQGD